VFYVGGESEPGHLLDAGIVGVAKSLMLLDQDGAPLGCVGQA